MQVITVKKLLNHKYVAGYHFKHFKLNEFFKNISDSEII